MTFNDMKITKTLTRYAVALAGLAVLAACSDSDNWQAGQQPKEGCQQVHFADTNSELTVLNDEDPADRTVTLTVVRNTTQGALTVPMTVEEADEGLEIPAEVAFSDGSDEATIDIKVTAQAEKGTSLGYCVRLTGDEIDPYAAFGGGSSFKGTISFPMAHTVRMWIAGLENVAGYWTETIYEMGKGQYRFNNLMQSGITLNMTLDANNRIALSSPQMSEAEGNVYPNYYNTGDCYFWCNRWDDSVGDYVYYPFYPHGKDARLWIDELDFYTDPNPSNWYSYYYDDGSQTGGYFSLSLGSLKLNTDKNNRYWQELRFRFLAEGENADSYLPEEPTPGEDPEPGNEVTFKASFYDYYDTFGGEFSIKAKKIGDNGYTFENFLGCGDDITFTIDPATGVVTCSGVNSYYYEDYFYLTTSDGYAAYAYPNYGATENYINYMYFYKDAPYTQWDGANKTLMLGTYFQMNDDYDNTLWDTLYLQLEE